MIKKIFFTVLFSAFTFGIFAQVRTFDQIFPHMSQEIRSAAFSDSGYVRTSQRTGGFSITGQNSRLDPQIVNAVLSKSPGYIVEAITIIPASHGTVSLLDVYNSLGNISGLKGLVYDSYSKGQSVPLFEEATRIVSERQTTAVADPVPARSVPASETVYIRLKDVNFGNTFYRGEMALIQNGLRYNMTNFRSMSYLFIPVIKEGKFVAQLYFEPIAEGVLIYSLAGADISDFFASRIHVESAISKRLAVITSWAKNGIISRSR